MENILKKISTKVCRYKISSYICSVIKNKGIMTTLETQVNTSVEFFLLAAKECGFETPEKIEENFKMVAFIASEMIKDSKDRVLTKLASNPNWIKYLAAKYQSKVLEND